MIVTCQACSQRVNVDESMRGMRVACPKCKAELNVQFPEATMNQPVQNPPHQNPPHQKPVQPGYPNQGAAPGPNPGYTGHQPPVDFSQPQHNPHGYRCPYCQSTAPPRTESEISTAGIVVLVVLITTCFPLFWIGLLIREDYHVCSSCNMRLSR